MSDDKKETGRLAELVKAAKRFSQLEKKSPDNGVDPNQLPPENTANAQVATDSDASSDMPVTEESASPSEPSPLIVDNIDPAPADAQKKTFQSQAVQLFLKLNRKQKVSVFLVLGLIIIGVFGPDTGSQVSSQNTSQRSTSQDTPSLDISENHARLATGTDQGWVTVDNPYHSQSLEIHFDLEAEASTLVDPQAPADQTTAEEQGSNLLSYDSASLPSTITSSTEGISPESLLPPMSPALNNLGLLPTQVEPLVELPPPPPIDSIPEPMSQKEKEVSAELQKKREKPLSTDKKPSKGSEPQADKKVVAKTKPATPPRVNQAVLRPQIKDLVIYRASPDCDICIPHAYFKIGKDEHEVGDGLEWEGFKVRIIGDRMTLSKNSKSFDFWYR